MRLIAISNRVPLPTAISGAGGLAVGLRDALAESGGIWFGWSGSHAAERKSVPSVVQEDNISFATLPLTAQDFERYYTGYSNSVLWPPFHERLHAMEYQEAFRLAYEDVNGYFGPVAASLIRPDDVVWVHD